MTEQWDILASNSAERNFFFPPSNGHVDIDNTSHRQYIINLKMILHRCTAFWVSPATAFTGDRPNDFSWILHGLLAGCPICCISCLQRQPLLAKFSASKSIKYHFQAWQPITLYSGPPLNMCAVYIAWFLHLLFILSEIAFSSTRQNQALETFNHTRSILWGHHHFQGKLVLPQGRPPYTSLSYCSMWICLQICLCL